MSAAARFFRRAFFQLHWLLGISAGLILAFMGVTGATQSFKDEILRALNPQVMRVQAQGPTLSAPQLLTSARDAWPERRVSNLTISSDPATSARVTYAPPAGAAGKGDPRYLDPSTGAMLGEARGEATLVLLEDLHRKLGAGDAGKLVTGICAIVLVFMALTGLYLRWPRGHARDWRRWLLFNPRLHGRGFLFGLHKVTGSWLLALYLLSALSGLYFAFDWYKDGVHALAGVPVQKRKPPRPPGAKEPGAPAPDISAAWTTFATEVPSFSTATLRLPEQPGQPVQINYLLASSPHDRAFNRIELDPASGAIRSHERYADKPRGGRFVASMFPLHSGGYFGLPGRLVTCVAALLMPLFAVTGWMMYLARRRIRR